jgi:hypothetical protein
MAKLPDGGKVGVFGPASPVNRHSNSGPVAGFLVGDVPCLPRLAPLPTRQLS